MEKKIIITFLLLFYLAGLPANLQSQSLQNGQRRMYESAKQRTVAQDWKQAARLYEKMIRKYPDSRYDDEAKFWVGYCLEKEDGRQEEAFQTFDELVKKRPDSPWADDAVFNQISLAESFVRKGDEKYRPFLKDQLANDDPRIRHQAALALGRLGDTSVLPVLKDMQDRGEFKEIAKSLVEELENAQNQEGALATDGKVKVGKNLKPAQKSKTRFALNAKPDHLVYYSEKRFAQYRALTHQNDEWTRDQLLTFGLWYILPPESFDDYYSLDKNARKEWLRMFWKRNDPTPLTDVNEAEIEFEKRVKYAREHFTYYDGLKDFYYAPWDARGEIYIKYGKPSLRKHDAYREYWYYADYNRISFFIRPKVTNIFGRAIFLDSRFLRTRRVDPEKLKDEYVFAPSFHFTLDRKIKPIRDFRVEIAKDSRGTSNILLHYELPIDELKIQRENKRYKVEYEQKYVLFDSKMNEIMRRENIQQVAKSSKGILKRQKIIKQTIRFELKPGNYSLALQIEDKKAKKLAVKMIDFQVKG
ncbi:MAG: GWxTD domain-containing protein [Calditrichaeota bacterium]|nr:GWxTD domain-containing protein [Calditrichota bacterium]